MSNISHVDESVFNDALSQQADDGIEVIDIKESPYETQDIEEEHHEVQENENNLEEPSPENLDEYGNEKKPERTYTQEELDEIANERANRAVRERMARFEKNNIPKQQDGRINPYPSQSNQPNEDDWQAQLSAVIRNEIEASRREDEYRIKEEKMRQEQEAFYAFQDKFERGMDRFADFREVVGSQPITDSMTHALRGIKDPSAFVYAASKRAPEELQRISRLSDPYAQIVEMGRLEERMRKTQPGTSAPKPVSRTREDSTVKIQKARDYSLEDLFLQEENRRLDSMRKSRTR